MDKTAIEKAFRRFCESHQVTAWAVFVHGEHEGERVMVDGMAVSHMLDASRADVHICMAEYGTLSTITPEHFEDFLAWLRSHNLHDGGGIVSDAPPAQGDSP